MPHIIRLRDPWQIERLTEPERVRCTRHFNQPTGLDSGERVWLVVESLADQAEIRVNDIPVRTTRCDITPLLAPRNKIEIELPLPSDGRPPASPTVRLEIVPLAG